MQPRSKEGRLKVRAKKGDPRWVQHGTNDFGAYTIFLYGRLRVIFQGNAGATAVFPPLLDRSLPAGPAGHGLSNHSEHTARKARYRRIRHRLTSPSARTTERCGAARRCSRSP